MDVARTCRPLAAATLCRSGAGVPFTRPIRFEQTDLDIKGVNWFGAEEAGACPDGPWQRPAATFSILLVCMASTRCDWPLAADNVLADPTVDKERDSGHFVAWAAIITGGRAPRALGRAARPSGDARYASTARRESGPTAHGLWYDPRAVLLHPWHGDPNSRSSSQRRRRRRNRREGKRTGELRASVLVLRTGISGLELPRTLPVKTDRPVDVG